MAFNSIDADIEAAIVATIQALPLETATSTALPDASIVAKMLPRAADGIAPAPPCILVAAATEKPQRVQTSFECVDCVYAYEVAIVVGSNRDLVTKGPMVRDWRQQISRAFDTTNPFTTTPTVWRVDVAPDVVFDRSTLNQQYGYSSLLLLVYSSEDRN